MACPAARWVCAVSAILALALLPVAAQEVPEGIAAVWQGRHTIDRPSHWQWAGGVQFAERDGHWFLRGQELEAVIEKSTGSLCRLVSLKPVPLALEPTTRHGLVIYAHRQQDDRWAVADRVNGLSLRPGKDHVEAEFLLEFDDRELARSLGPVRLSYRMDAERLDVSAELEYAQDDPRPYEIGVVVPYRQQSWRKMHFIFNEYGAGASEAGDINDTRRMRYYDAIWDDTPGKPWSQELHVTGTPYCIVERPDRLWLWGRLDLNGFAVFAPNRFGCLPAFTINPKGLRRGQAYSFQFFCKVFPTAEAGPFPYATAVRWYYEHAYSTNPLTRGLVTLPKTPQLHSLPPGNITFHYAPWEVPGTEEVRQEFFRKWEEHTQRLHLTHLWYSAGRANTPGERWPLAGTQMAERIRENMRELQGKGYRIFFYCRQLYRPIDMEMYGLPYKDWLFRDKTGGYVPYEHTWALPDLVRRSDPLPNEYYWADFCNPDFIQWYIADVKRAVDYYQPDGIAWDMGWLDGWMGACYKHPETGVHHGELRVQAEIYRWLKRKYPHKYVIQNGNLGTPSQLYADAVMFEGGFAAPWDAQAAKAFGAVVVNLNYPDLFLQAYGKDRHPEMHVRTMLRNLALGAVFGGRGCDLFPISGLGEWNAGILNMGSHENRMTDYADFSALAASLYSVTEPGAIEIRPSSDQVFGSLWARGTGLLAAVFNSTERETVVHVRVDRSRLASYGYSYRRGSPVIVVLGPDGLPVSSARAQIAADNPAELVVLARLGPQYLLLIQ